MLRCIDPVERLEAARSKRLVAPFLTEVGDEAISKIEKEEESEEAEQQRPDDRPRPEQLLHVGILAVGNSLHNEAPGRAPKGLATPLHPVRV